LSTSAISRRYAKALVEMGAEQQMVERYGDELARVSSVLASQDLLRLILESPSFPQEKKSAILTDVVSTMKLSDGMKSFLGLLLAKDRLKYIPQIEGNYRNFADELSGTLRAHLTAASALDEGEQKSIRAELERKTGKQIKLSVDLDPSLIGGLKAQVGGKVFDCSLKTQLKRIEDTLKKG